eukprot:TRINITY_DN10364_c0_g2_i2.p1 TRINITY_DN10364_c0_g2~~TRINITY_DN10364_c0_g2_i2.p1  ORF type:complete len:797 (-),score=187.97 TRINITY_DN10364_c0_g2_i2:615-3005(-)
MVHMAFIALGTFGVVSLIVGLVMPHVPAFQGYSMLCRSQAALLIGAMSIERSASSALAVISETKAKGVLTKTTLGITVASDVVLLIFFAFTSTFAEAACTPLGFNVETFLSLVVSVLICIIGGFVLGEILIFYLWIPGIPSQARGVLILPTGYFVFYFADLVLEKSKAITGMQINMEPLLLCMIASCLAGNESKNRRKFANILHKSAPYVFVPFFTLTGAGLNLEALVSSLSLAAILVAARASVICLSTFIAGKYVLKQPKKDYRLLWLTLLPQAGTLLGLVNELQTYGDWATPICSAAIAALIVNNVVGLRLFKWAIYQSGEAVEDGAVVVKEEKFVQVEADLGDMGHVKVFGVNALALSLGVKICEFGYSVTAIAPKSTPPQKLSQAVQFANASLQGIRSSSRNVQQPNFSETFSSVNFNVCTEMIDVDYMKKVYRKLETIPSSSNLAMPDEPGESTPDSQKQSGASNVNDPENPVPNGDNESETIALNLKEFKSEEVFISEDRRSELERQSMSRDAFSDIFVSFSHMISDDTTTIVLCFPDDDVNWITGNLLVMYLNDNKIDRMQMRIVAVIKEASWGTKFQAIGITPVYSLSAITDVVSRIAVSDPNEPLVIEPEDVREMIHPMEAGTKCGLTIADASKVPSVRNIDASPRLIRRISGRSLFDGNLIFDGSIHHGTPLYNTPGFPSAIAATPEKKAHQKISSFNQLSGLGALGLADPTYTEEKKMPAMLFDIYDEHIQQLSSRSPENEPLLPKAHHFRHNSTGTTGQILLDSPGIRTFGKQRPTRRISYDSS